MILRRITFGEPKPGFQKFADSLSSLASSVGYCNRIGPLQHDRVTDLPFTMPLAGFDFVHPTPLSFVCAEPPPNDPYGIFAPHHSELYAAGAVSAALDPLHIEAARLCAAIYKTAETWNVRDDTAGVDWAIKAEGARIYVVFRGTDNLLDFVRDLTAVDLPRIFHHDNFGRMWEGFLIGMDAAWDAIKPLLAQYDEIVFTGHSLGGARASIAAGYALLEGWK